MDTNREIIEKAWEDRELLKNLKPNTALMDYVANLPKLQIIDGTTCGL